MSSQIAVVMVPLPAQGHLNQLLHLSRLITADNTTVYFTGAATHLRQAGLRLHGWDPSSTPNLYFHHLPSPPFTTPAPDPHAPHRFPSQLVPALTASTHLRQPVYEFVDGLSQTFRKVVVIYDLLMSYVVQDLGSIANAGCYLFRSISCFSVCSWGVSTLPNLPSEAEILKEIPSVEGYYSKEFSDFLDLQYGAKVVSRGEIFNTCEQIEGLYLDLWEEQMQKFGGGSLWPLGPFFTPSKISKKTDHKCLKWLSKHPPNSVILISFGTTSCFSDEQIGEIATGLERSGQRFIWVLRNADKGDIFAEDARESHKWLPLGFEERVRERGIVVREWAPQMEILEHSSTGGFMSHCGWNSCLESIVNGVPIAAWPMHSDQPANAVLVARVLGIGVEVASWTRRGDGLVAAGRVEEVVREMMASPAGEEMRRRAAEMGKSIEESMMEGGIGWKKIQSFVDHISNN